MRLFSEEVAEGFIRDGWWTGRTWSDLVDQHRREVPGRTALVDPPNRLSYLHGGPRRLTWDEVGDQIDRLARVLFAYGVRRDVVVGVQLPNCVELPLVFLAVARLGGIVTPFPVQYQRHELQGMGEAAGVELFVTANHAVGRDYAAELVQLSAEIPSLKTVLAFGVDPVEGAGLLDELMASEEVDPVELRSYLDGLEQDSNDCVTLVWTSGTEGKPKGVPRAYGDWEVLASACAQSPRLTSDDVLLNPFPMVNGGGLAGMFLPWLTLGSTLVQHQPFDFDVFVGQIESEQVTYTCAPPLVLDTLVADERAFAEHDLSTLRAVGSGSAPLSGWMIARWETDHGVEVLNLFGSNEGGVLFADPETVPDPSLRGRFFPRYGVPDMPYRIDVARAMSGRLVSLENGQEITEPGQPGELRLKGPTIFAGYWNQGRHGFDEDGWFCTGDVFEISADNPDYLTHVDRAKDLIIRGGFKISAAELEGLVIADERVAAVAAVAMPDERLGERVCLFIVPRVAGQAPTLIDVIAALAEKGVAKFKWPERLEIVDELPRNAIGKILKRDLRLLLAQPENSQVQENS